MAEFKEVMRQYSRMCTAMGSTCDGCLLHPEKKNSCWGLMRRQPELVERLVMEWAKKHPEKTMKDVLLENFPNAQLNRDGTPPFCVRELGLPGQKDCARPCKECWNSPAPEE